MSESNRSPLKDKPLRHAGQSLEEERQKLLDDQVETPLLFALVYGVLAALEWWREVSSMRPQPWLFSLIAVVATAWAAWRIYRIRPRLRALRLGLDGERVVGQYLDGLRARGYSVFHDIVGSRFNIDHVLIGPAGVFTVETKTWSKPARGDARIRFDGEALVVAGQHPERDPVVQAQAQASWLRQVLLESTGKTFEIRPVVLFPGWFVEQAPGGPRGLWVLEPKALPSFLEREPQRLTPEDARLAVYHLSRYIRVGEAERSDKK